MPEFHKCPRWYRSDLLDLPPRNKEMVLATLELILCRSYVGKRAICPRNQQWTIAAQ
jgi:hypothetical protein